jgi:hypothetical protein
MSCASAHILTRNVQSPTESDWPDDGSVGTETCCLFYFNKLYVSVVFRRSTLLIYISWFDSRHEQEIFLSPKYPEHFWGPQNLPFKDYRGFVISSTNLIYTSLVSGCGKTVVFPHPETSPHLQPHTTVTNPAFV